MIQRIAHRVAPISMPFGTGVIGSFRAIPGLAG